MSPSTPIEANHAKTQFVEDPGVIAAAVAQGCALVDNADNPHEALRYLDKKLLGLPFQHFSPDGELIPQFRPDDAEDGAKYVVPKGVGSVPPTNSNLTTGRPVVAIVEGAKQMIFAVAYAPEDVLVLGIQECWGWSFQGQALASLDALVEGRDVIVIFDAGVASSPYVYAAGKTLVETLEVIGASKVTFASTPGDGAVGLDDFLFRRRIEERGEVFARILAKSVPFTKITKPANWRKGAVSHVYGSNAKGVGEVEIARVFDAVANGPYFISPKGCFNNGTPRGQILAGFETTVKINGVQTDCIALVPEIVGKMIGLDDRVIDALLIRDKAGRRTRSVRIGNRTTRCFVITKAAWNGDAQKS